MRYLLIVPLLGLIFSCGDKNAPHTVQKRKLNEAVYASGEIWPNKYEQITVSTPQKVVHLAIEEGDTVAAGDVLAILGAPAKSSELDFASDQVSLALKNTLEKESPLADLKTQLQLAEQTYRQDALNADRYGELAEDKAVSQQEAEEMALKAQSSLSELTRLENRYQIEKRKLTNELLSRKKELARLRQNNVLTSHLKGKVYGIYQQEGETAQAGDVIMMIGSPRQFKLELLVDERDINKIKLGQQVHFETDAFPDQQFSAQITKIIPVLQKESRSFQVEALVNGKNGFFPQSSIEANIVIRKNVEVPMIPFDYLYPGDSVSMAQESDPRMTKVTVGSRDGKWVEIKSGLEPGDIIYKNAQ